MKLSNGKMSLYLNSLNKISNKVKGKLAYCVARNMRKLSSELTEFENIKNNYICEHGVEDENGFLRSKYQVTYNIPEKMKDKNKTFLDIYKYPEIKEFFENNIIGSFTGRCCSGINNKLYPEFVVDLSKFIQTPGFREGEYN